MLVARWDEEYGLISFHIEEQDCVAGGSDFNNGDNKVIVRTRDEVSTVMKVISLLTHSIFVPRRVIQNSTPYIYYTETRICNEGRPLPKLIAEYAKD